MKKEIIKKERSSNLELLRIVLMMMVVTLHYLNTYMGGILDVIVPGTFNYYLAHFLESLCIVSVNVFVLITGYFSHKKTSIKVSKVGQLFSLGIFYSLVLAGIAVFILKLNPINRDTLNLLNSSIFGSWFLVIYCFLYLLIPFINKLINNINEKQLLTLIIINVLMLNVYYTFFNTITLVDGGYGIGNFINLYLIGAYISKYKNKDISIKYPLITYILITIVTTIFSFKNGLAWQYSTIFNVLGSVSLFLIFKNIKMKNYKFINNIAGYIFPIYCIHTCPFTAKYMFREIFNTPKYWHSNYMIVHLIITVLGVFIGCIIIEIIRRFIFGKIIDKNIDKIKYEVECK